MNNPFVSMNNPIPSSEDSRLDEWGNYIKKSEDVIRINDDGVLEAIQNNNPAITAVSVNVGYNEATEISDWGAVGRYLGHSSHVKHLEMNFWKIIDSLDLQSFCDGLAVNTSVESLEIYLDLDPDDDEDDEIEEDDEQERLFSFPNELIGKLLPFFKNNSNLIAVDFSFQYNTPPTDRVSDVISASLALKSVKIKFVSERSLKELASVICKKEGVCHITFNGGSLNKGDCLQIKKFLSGEHCQLKSFALSDVRVSDNVCIDNIISGIFNNKSLECLQLLHGNYTRSFLESLQHTKLSSIKKLILTPAKLPPITSLCRQLPNVTSLRIQTGLHTEYKLIKSMWGESCIEQEQASSSTLQELVINGFVARETHIEELNSCLSNHCMLKSLSIYKSLSLNTFYGDDSEMCLDIFQSIPTPQLDSISIMGLVISDSLMRSFCNWMSRIPTLRVLDMRYSCRNVSLEGWQSLSTALESLPIIEEVDFAYIDSEVNGVPDIILHALLARPTLKKVSFNISGINQLWVVANSLQNPDCLLTELKIGYSPERNLTKTEIEQVCQIMVDALQRNATLKTLEFQFETEDQDEDDDFFNWEQFSDLLCNKSSIETTYVSNHTLQSLSIKSHYVNTIPLDIYSMLHSNKLQNKHAVAREKILQHHKLEDANFIHSSLPVAMSWIGKSNSNFGLSQQYRLIRSAPHLFQNVQKKRKRDG